MPMTTGGKPGTQTIYFGGGRKSYHQKTRSYSGPGKAPKGAKITSTPTVTTTVSSSGKISTTATGRRGRRAVRSARASQRRVRRIVRSLTPSPQKAANPRPSPALPKFSPPPTSKPEAFHGNPTAGTPTLGSLQSASKSGSLKVNRAGYVTTPKVRRAGGELKSARKAVKRSQPSLAGLSPAERDAAHYAEVAHRKYPDVPTSVLMSDQRQESNFDPNAVSSAGAFGRSQFIPPTAAEYGVKPGSSKQAKRSQAVGQAHYLHDLDFAKDPQGALSGYSGGYSASAYNNPVLAGAKDYAALDKPGNPRAVRRLAKAKAQAEAVGLKVKPTVGEASREVVTRFKAAQAAMKEVEGLPYVWGGGHGSPTSSPTGGGLDCSGAVGYVLNKIGAMHGSLTSGDMGSVLKPGPGALTVFYNANHTFLRLGNEYWGTSVGDSGSGGLGPHAPPSASYLAQYKVGHVAGLGQKQALQLGFTATSFPGMTLSSSGTSATIDSGAGATVGKPGFSSKPIQLTQRQKMRRAMKKLRAIDGRQAAPTGQAAPAGAVSIADLERKYGKAAA